MTDLRIDRKTGARILAAISLLALIAGAIVYWLPKPNPKSMAAGKSKQVSDLQTKANNAKAESAFLEASIAKLTWRGTVAEVGPSALATVTRLAKTHHVKLSTFRPQKAVDLKGLTELPFLMAVEGSFPDCAGLVRDLEKPDNRLAVTMLQLSAGDQSSDKLTATLSLAAFVEQKPAAKTDDKAKKMDDKAKGANNGKTL